MFAPNDFQLTTEYSYNLINGSNILRNYDNYILDVPNNTITFNFNNSQISTYAPSITSPLMIQFYLENVTFPFQIGGVPPEVGLLKVFNISQTAVEMSWTSAEETITQIEYGITTAYGSVSILNEDLTNTHHLVLTGLLPNTTYHYRIIDTLQDYTFITLS
jgi:hypothetical protein